MPTIERVESVGYVVELCQQEQDQLRQKALTEFYMYGTAVAHNAWSDFYEAYGWPVHALIKYLQSCERVRLEALEVDSLTFEQAKLQLDRETELNGLLRSRLVETSDAAFQCELSEQHAAFQAQLAYDQVVQQERYLEAGGTSC